MPGIVHFEIPADDQERAREFYRAAFDWKVDPIPGMDYTNVVTTPVDEATQQPLEPGAINGGMFQRADRLTTPILTVDVEDIDRSLERIVETGGSVVSPARRCPAWAGSRTSRTRRATSSGSGPRTPAPPDRFGGSSGVLQIRGRDLADRPSESTISSESAAAQ